jgi:hypothetical protein
MMMRVHRSPGLLAVRGVSILEFVGCLSAMAGGVVLGSMYLGVNVKEMAYAALEHAHVVQPRRQMKEGEKLTEPQAAPRASEAPSTAEQPNDTTSAGTAAGPAAEPQPQAPPEQTAADGEAADSAPSAPVSTFFARQDLITDEQRTVLTLAYWDQLAVCMQGEVTTRVPAIDAEGNWQLFEYLTGRKDGHRKAAEAIAQMDPRGVDDHVLAYAKKARAWHEDGAKLFGRAVDLLTDAPTAQLSGPFAQSWQSAATQHRMEARLLEEKQQSVKSYLDHAYQASPAAAPAATAK